MMTLTKEELIAFEDEIKELYENAKIKAPVHFSKGNEEQLIDIFKDVNENDWVFSTHRSHYHALLKGIDKEWLKNEIIGQRSIHLNSREHKFFTSAIVGGILPIALGTALGIKLKNSKEHVWVFVGDMAAEMGIFYECTKYARRNSLQVTFVIEDNGLSVETPTQKCWGEDDANIKIIRYKYMRFYPHHGVGRFINF